MANAHATETLRPRRGGAQSHCWWRMALLPSWHPAGLARAIYETFFAELPGDEDTPSWPIKAHVTPEPRRLQAL